MKTHPIEDKISQEFFAAIGLVVTEWAALEHRMTYMISALIGLPGNEMRPDSRGILLVSGMDSRVKIGAIKSLVMYAHSYDLSPLCDNLEKLKRRRDLFAHNPVMPTDDKNRVKIPAWKTIGNIKFSEQKYTVKDIRNLANEIHDAAVELKDFIEGELKIQTLIRAK